MKLSLTPKSPLFEQFPYIVAWGRMMRSFDYYITTECEKAAADKAPSTAVYYSDMKNKWVQVSDLGLEAQEDIKNYLVK